MDQNRRRLLISLGYGAASVATLGAINALPESTGRAVVDAGSPTSPPPSGLADSGATAEVAGITQTAPPPAPADPVVLDASLQADASARFDAALIGGRVMDPDSGLDRVLNVGVIGGAIAYIGSEPIEAGTVVDASGQVVAPGFIDILSYRPNSFGVWYKVADGVTTNLGMHGINNYAAPFFDRFTGAAPVHFGGAFHQHFHRGHTIGASPDRELSRPQIDDFARLCGEQVAAGFAGVALSPEYSPGTSRDEIMRLAEAAGPDAVLFFHARYSDPDPPGTNAEAIAEVLDIARTTGLPVHISHITSTGGTFTMNESLGTLEAARAEGLDVTACLYPYDFWATRLQSFRFAGDWRARYRIDVGDLQVGGTDVRLDSTTYDQARAENKLVAALGSIPAEEVDLAMRTPWTIVGSDAIAEPDGNNHPRAAGTFARTLGVYVRERQVLGLMEALAKMTILPARRTEGMLPAIRRKGRLQIGADADMTVFDPATIADRATVAAPATESAGISHVYVGGTAVLENGTLRRDRLPGQPLR